MKKLEEYVSDLSYSPRLYVEIEKYKGTKKVYRRMVVNKYVVLYNIDEEKKKVFIAHMFYGGSDYINKIQFEFLKKIKLYNYYQLQYNKKCKKTKDGETLKK